MIEEVEKVIEETPVTLEVEVNDEVVGKRENNKSLVLLLLVMVFSLLGLFVYLFITDRLILGIDNPFSDKKITVIDKEEPNEEDKVDENPTDEVKNEKTPLITYYNSTLWPYKLKYPQDWEITKEETSCAEMGICTFHELEITYTKNPQYALYLHSCSECGPNPPFCAYSDVEYPDEMIEGMISQIYYDSFTIIDDGTFRRSSNPREKDNSDFKYRICQKGGNEKDGFFYAWGGIIAGDVAYKAPDNADENILKVMDNILLSLEELPR